jgi:two-component system response regulator PrrA
MIGTPALKEAAVSRDIREVLVVDDDQGVRDALRRGLALEGFVVREAADGLSALREIALRQPAAIVVDVAMPGMSGVQVTRQLRVEGRTLPVCILSARDEVDDRVAGLEAGADDYVVKPFSVAELAARLHAMVRLHERRHGMALRVGELDIDPARRIAARNGRDLGLTTREFDLLLVFGRHPGQVLNRDQLLTQVWGYTWDVDTNVVDVFVGYLRRKLEATGEPRLLQTVRGVGFVLRV